MTIEVKIENKHVLGENQKDEDYTINAYRIYQNPDGTETRVFIDSMEPGESLKSHIWKGGGSILLTED